MPLKKRSEEAIRILQENGIQISKMGVLGVMKPLRYYLSLISNKHGFWGQVQHEIEGDNLQREHWTYNRMYSNCI